MNRQRILLFILLCVSLRLHTSFNSLSQLASYAEHALEYPEIDNIDWERPDFTSFYMSRKPTSWSRFKNFFGVQKTIFDLTEFGRILQDVTNDRMARGFHGKFAQKLVFKNQGSLIVFGDLQGAYHSLVRSLKYLVTLDILSQELMLNEASYVVFNGNLIDSSAYNLEALMAVLVLMQKNPEHVIYIRGQNESDIKKEESTLYSQLKIIAPEKADVLFDQIKAFFDTLPLALYAKRDENEVLKIFSQTADQFDDKQLGNFLSLDNKSDLLHAGDVKSTLSGISVGAIIQAYDYSRTLGLKRYVGPPITWQVFSSPTGAHRRLYGFFSDAFAIVDSSTHFNDWMITLYANDLQAPNGFDMMGTYNLSTGIFISGKQIDFFDGAEIKKFKGVIEAKEKLLADLKEKCKKDNGATSSQSKKILAEDVGQQTLRLGVSGDLSKAAKNIGKKIKETLTKAFEEKNNQGGVRGVSFQGIFLDDAYTPEIARQNFLKFVDELNVDILLASFGTATTQESLDLVNADKMILLFPAATESRPFRDAKLKNAVSLTVSYYEQGKALIDYIFQKSPPKKIAFIYQNDDFGKDGLSGAKAALKKYNFTQIVELPYERNQVDFLSQIKVLKQENPDAIGFFGLPLAAMEFMKNIGALFLSTKVMFGISDLRDNDLMKFMDEKGISFVYANSLPDWQTSSMELAKDYKRFAASNRIVPDPFSFETYVIAQVLFYLIEHIDGPVTKEKLIQAAEKVKNIDFKGLNLNFDPESRVLLDAVWIAQNNNEPWTKVIVKEPSVEEVVLENPSVATEAVPIVPEATKAAEAVVPQKSGEKMMLTLGTSLDLSKTLKKAHEVVKDTLTRIFEIKNKSGGINGLLIRDVFLDDAYTPSIARKNYLNLLNDMQVDLIFGSRGTPTTKEVLDLVKDGRMALLFLIGTESSIFRTADLKNVINLTASYYEQGKALIEDLFQGHHPDKIAFFYQDDDFGKDVLDGAKEALEKRNFTNVVEIPYLRGQVAFASQADIIKKEKPDAIGFFSTPFPAMELIKSVGAGKLSGKFLFGSSVLREQDFLQFMQDKGLSFVYANSLPDWQADDVQIAQEYRKFVSQNSLQPDPFGFEAYIVAHLLFYLIEQVDGLVTKEKLIQAAEKIHNYNFKGLALDFNPLDRILLSEVWIAKNNREPWIKIKLDAPKAVEQIVKEAQQVVVMPENLTEVKKDDEKPVMALHGDLFILGNTADVSKGLKSMSSALRQGLETGVNEINRQGGIKGMQLKIVYLDDEYEPAIAKENVEKFLSEYNTNVFISSVGTPTLEGYIDLVINGKVALFFPFTGSSTFRKMELKNLLNFSPSYDATAGAATNYILKTFSPRRWVLLYQNDSFGTVPKNAIKGLLEKHNIKDILEIPFERNDVNFTQQAKDILAFKPEVIGFFGPAVSAQGFIRVAGVKEFSDKILYGLPWLAGEKMQNFLKEKGLKMIIPSVVPNPKMSDLPIVKDFRQAAESKGISLDVNALEGYIHIRLFSHLLKQVEGTITIEKIMHVAEKMKDVDFGGLKLNFDPNLRQLSHHTWLDLGTDNEWVEIDLAAEHAK